MNEIVDDSAMDMHKEQLGKNTKDVINERFNRMFDNTYKNAHAKQYDLDATKPVVSYKK